MMLNRCRPLLTHELAGGLWRVEAGAQQEVEEEVLDLGLVFEKCFGQYWSAVVARVLVLLFLVSRRGEAGSLSWTFYVPR